MLMLQVFTVAFYFYLPLALLPSPPSLLPRLPWFSPVKAVTSVLFIFHVFSLHSWLQQPSYTHTHTHTYILHQGLLGSQLPLTLVNTTHTDGAPFTLPWKHFTRALAKRSGCCFDGEGECETIPMRDLSRLLLPRELLT